MNILVLNSGSSSLKFDVMRADFALGTAALGVFVLGLWLASLALI